MQYKTAMHIQPQGPQQAQETDNVYSTKEKYQQSGKLRHTSQKCSLIIPIFKDSQTICTTNFSMLQRWLMRRKTKKGHTISVKFTENYGQ